MRGRFVNFSEQAIISRPQPGCDLSSSRSRSAQSPGSFAVIWLRFVGRFEVNLVPAALTGTFVMFFTLFLLTVSTLSVDRRPLELSFGGS